MSGARTIEVQEQPPTLDADHSTVFIVRLCDGSQVLTERRMNLLNDEDHRLWQEARRHMLAHDQHLSFFNGMVRGVFSGRDYDREVAAIHFARAVAVLFPEFGTVPDGVETTT